MDNVIPFSPSPSPAPSGGDDIEARLVKIETQMEHAAKREDIARLETSIARLETLIEKRISLILRWLLGILLTAMMAAAIALFRTFY